MECAAILIAPQGTSGQLRSLVERLTATGVQVTIVDELSLAVDIYENHEAPPAILVDLRDVDTDDPRLASDSLKRIQQALPHTHPIPVLSHSTPALILACIRGGAGDVIDLKLEGTANSKSAIQRTCDLQRDRTTLHQLIAQQRSMIEDLLKDLIKTERRSIDVEEKLAAHTRATGETPAITESRSPAILLVEHDRAVADELTDRLEGAGVATFAYVTGEEALRECKTLSKSATGLDLALVAAQLPGIDGLETIRRLRERIANLPAFLMTSVLDADLAAAAADLGVVGFVTKPLADLDEVVQRLTQLAKESLERVREQNYVQRIKQRHERVLERYRSLPREP
ncbi:MAG: response regulator [Deltaproteobacteria bacterium]|nr:response regulator [Deltaproteobacteria bacterium]